MHASYHEIPLYTIFLAGRRKKCRGVGAHVSLDDGRGGRAHRGNGGGDAAPAEEHATHATKSETQDIENFSYYASWQDVAITN